jgi:hypothetical protein
MIIFSKTFEKKCFTYLLISFIGLVSCLSYTKYYSLKLRGQIKDLNISIEQELVKKQDFRLQLQSLTKPERIKALAAKYLPNYSYMDSSRLMQVSEKEEAKNLNLHNEQGG